MSTGQAVILGILQGITEFLPVSSSGHLAIAQRVFQIEEPTLLFDTFLHTGTLIAVFIALRADVWALLRRPFQKRSALIILATALTAVFAFTLRFFARNAEGVSLLDHAFQSGVLLGGAFLLTSAALLSAEWRARHGRPVRGDDEMNWLDAAVIGVMQGIGVLPGVSRSGITLAGALGRRIKREAAARFSFILSIPAILGALALQVKDLRTDGAALPFDWSVILAGTLSAALVGTFSIRIMLKIVRSRPLTGFAAYTALLGASVLFDTLITHRFF
jgi:undecaprenyl-diphosphatase